MEKSADPSDQRTALGGWTASTRQRRDQHHPPYHLRSIAGPDDTPSVRGGTKAPWRRPVGTCRALAGLSCGFRRRVPRQRFLAGPVIVGRHARQPQNPVSDLHPHAAILIGRTSKRGFPRSQHEATAAPAKKNPSPVRRTKFYPRQLDPRSAGHPPITALLVAQPQRLSHRPHADHFRLRAASDWPTGEHEVYVVPPRPGSTRHRTPQAHRSE